MSFISSDQEQKIRQMAQSGNVIGAIKEYRTLTNAGLKEAKDAVEAIMRSAPAVNYSGPQIAGPSTHTSVDGEIREMLARKKKIEAIKIYRKATNLGLKEAKDYVEAIEAQMSLIGPTRPLVTPSTLQDDPLAREIAHSRFLLPILVLMLILVLAALAFIFFLSGF